MNRFPPFFDRFTVTSILAASGQARPGALRRTINADKRKGGFCD
jgi:hypothetical protein